MKQRHTRQLTATRNALVAATDHPTAEMLLARVRRHVPGVSLGTIYRNLEKLHDQGQIRVIRLAGGIARYDAFLEPHDHFVCEACGAVLDLPRAGVSVDVAGLEKNGCVVRSQSVAVYGLCASCARPERLTRGHARRRGTRSAAKDHSRSEERP